MKRGMVAPVTGRKLRGLRLLATLVLVALPACGGGDAKSTELAPDEAVPGTVWLTATRPAATTPMGAGGDATADQACAGVQLITHGARQQRVTLITVAIYGHAMPLVRLAEELACRGHDVTVATHEQGRDWVPPGVKFLSAGPFPLAHDEFTHRLRKISQEPSAFRGILSLFQHIYLPLARPLFQNLQPTLAKEPPDLIVMDVGTIGARDVAHSLGVPIVVNSPTLLLDLTGHPPSIPAWGTGFGADMTLVERCINMLFPRLLSVALTPSFMHLNRLRWELQLPLFESQEDIVGGARLLANSAFGLDFARPLSPLTTMTGPLLPRWTSHPPPAGQANAEHTGGEGHQEEGKYRLPPLIEHWLNGEGEVGTASNAGVVFISLGHLPHIEPWQASALVGALANATTDGHALFRVIWLVPEDQRPSLPTALPSNVRVKTFGRVPHLEVVSHAAVRVVVSHCGLGSALEALVFDKPLVCIPFLGDQPDVAARVRTLGAGRVLDKTTLNEEEVRQVVMDVLTRPIYRQVAAKLGAALRTTNGLATAATAVESMLYLGSEHLEPAALRLPWHQANMLDVLALYAAGMCVCVLLLHCCWTGCLVLARWLLAAAVGLAVPQRRTSSTGGTDKDKTNGVGSPVAAALGDAHNTSRANAAASATRAGAAAPTLPVEAWTGGGDGGERPSGKDLAAAGALA